MDKVERLLRDKVIRHLQEMIDVTSPNTVWVDPKWVEDNPVVEEADQGKILLLSRREALSRTVWYKENWIRL